ncbi:MAG: hypothetical protein HY362_03605 [Candidatus Aenigmarchaeota archaeon]|nr:hypothetical protein [Candidatus Aenigmarchaeota archaeon]
MEGYGNRGGDYVGDSHGPFDSGTVKRLERAEQKGTYVGPFRTAREMIDHILRSSPRVSRTR